MHKGHHPVTSTPIAAAPTPVQSTSHHHNNNSSSNNHQPFLANIHNHHSQPSTSAAAMAAMNVNHPQNSSRMNLNSNNQFLVDSNFSAKSKVPKGATVAVRNGGRERQLIGQAIVAPPPLPPVPAQQLTSLSMNDLDLIEELPPMSTAELRNSGRPITSTEEYKQPNRLYRKRPRFQNPQIGGGGGATRRRILQDSSSAVMFSMPNRRVLSLECLSPPNNQTESSPFYDVSYLDTGDLCLVNKGDGPRCIFVTDFL